MSAALYLLMIQYVRIGVIADGILIYLVGLGVAWAILSFWAQRWHAVVITGVAP